MFVFLLPIFLSDTERPFKQARLPTSGRTAFFDDLVIDLLEQSRNGRHDRRFYFLQVRSKLIKRGAIIDGYAVGAEDIKNSAFENMRQRQNGERSIGRCDRQSF